MAVIEQTPHSNTGSTHTSGGQVIVSVDWLEWTAGEGSRLLQVLPEVGGLDLTELGHGMNGYRKVHQVAGVKILSDGGTSGMGRHYIVGGEALRGLEADLRVGKEELLRRVLEVHQGSITRLDIAVDVVNRGIGRELIQQAYDSRGVVSRLRKWREHAEKDMDGNYQSGWSFYVGAWSSGCEVNIYDKRAEQLGKGNQSVKWLQDWVRFEWRLGKKFAGQFAGVLLAGDMGELRSLLTCIVDFVERGSDSNKWRSQRVGWYEGIMGDLKRGQILVPERGWDAFEAREWLRKSMGKSLLKVARAWDVSVSELARDLAEYGRAQWTERDEEDVRRWRQV